MLDPESWTLGKVLSPPNKALRVKPKPEQGSLCHAGNKKGSISPARTRELTTKGALGWITPPQLLAHWLSRKRPCLQRPTLDDKILRHSNKNWGVNIRWIIARERIQLRLGLKNGSKGLILNLQNVYYLPNSPCNLVNLELLNNCEIFYDNENKTLYQLESKRVLVQVRQWRNSYLLKPLNLSDAVVFLVRIGDETYKWSPHVFFSSSSSQTSVPITTWYKRLGHTNFASLKGYLKRLGVSYIDDSEGHICDSCQRAKATKFYNWELQKRSQQPYQFIYTNFVGSINLIGFLGKWYFFTFTDDCTKYMETYTGLKKSDWLRYIKIFHSLCCTKSK